MEDSNRLFYKTIKMKLSDSSIIDVNNLGEKELNEFVLQCLSLMSKDMKERELNQNDELIYLLFEKINDINESIEKKILLSESFRKISNKKTKYKIMEGFFELIYFFEENEEYENCAILKKVKDSLLIDL
tara:strand:+ start:122 stop:511 length:390 start_codon:yes stop_codon:yes gene_type:complete